MTTSPRHLPLRWGTHGSRLAVGAILIISSAVGIAGVNTNVLQQLLIPGVLAHIAGWCVLPSDGWRRVVAVLLSTPAALLLLTGPLFIVVLVLPYLAWLIARHSPLRSYPTLVFPLAAGVILPRIFSEYSAMLPALGAELLVIIGSAAAAHRLSSRRVPRESP